MTTDNGDRPYRAIKHADLLNLTALMSAERKTIESMTNAERARWASDQVKLDISTSTIETITEHLGLPVVTKRRKKSNGYVDRKARDCIRTVALNILSALLIAHHPMADDDRDRLREAIEQQLRDVVAALEDSSDE